LRGDLKTEVDFVPRRADFGMRLKKSNLDCRVKRTLDATTVVDLAPHGSGLKMQKTKSTFRKEKAKKSEKTSSFSAGAGLRLRPKSACATGVDLDATVSVDWCHQSGLGCDR
jgi:hypothetical protein